MVGLMEPAHTKPSRGTLVQLDISSCTALESQMHQLRKSEKLEHCKGWPRTDKGIRTVVSGSDIGVWMGVDTRRGSQKPQIARRTTNFYTQDSKWICWVWRQPYFCKVEQQANAVLHHEVQTRFLQVPRPLRCISLLRNPAPFVLVCKTCFSN